jgi:hypothetical protein
VEGVSSKFSVLALISGSALPFYVYVLRRPNGMPLYIGKGQGQRLLYHEAEAKGFGKSYKLNIIRALWKAGEEVAYEIDAFFATEGEAHHRERALIELFGRHDLGRGPLANLTDGGEGASNPSVESRKKHRDTLYGTSGDGGDRSIVNRFFQKLTSVESVPIKPLIERKVEPVGPHPEPRKFSPRQAAALAGSAIANRIMLEANCRIPRRLVIDGVPSIIENGVARDLLKSGMADLAPDSTPRHEVFLLPAAAVDYIKASIGVRLLEDAGILEPVIT